METREEHSGWAYEGRKEWSKPIIVTLDFSETRTEKVPGGADGNDQASGSMKTS